MSNLDILQNLDENPNPNEIVPDTRHSDDAPASNLDKNGLIKRDIKTDLEEQGYTDIGGDSRLYRGGKGLDQARIDEAQQVSEEASTVLNMIGDTSGLSPAEVQAKVLDLYKQQGEEPDYKVRSAIREQLGYTIIDGVWVKKQDIAA